jgi:tetratricopeptide (TPR) repeat protein
LFLSTAAQQGLTGGKSFWRLKNKHDRGNDVRDRMLVQAAKAFLSLLLKKSAVKSVKPALRPPCSSGKNAKLAARATSPGFVFCPKEIIMRRLTRSSLLLAGLLFFTTAIAAQEGEGFWRLHIDGAWQACREGDYSRASELVQIARKAADKFTADDPRLALTLSYGAFISFKQGKTVGADKDAQRALEMYEQAAPEKTADMGKGLNALGLLRQGQKKYPEAAGLYQKAIAVEEKAHGANHPAIAQLLANQASCLEAQGRYQEAEPLLKRAHEIRAQKEEMNLVSLLQQMGHFYHAWGKDGLAEEYLKRSLDIAEKHPGKGKLELATCQASLGKLFFEQKKYKRAASLFEDALAIRQKAQGELSAPLQLDLASVANNLGAVYLAQSEFDKAEPLFKRALTIRQKAFKKPDVRLAISFDNMAAVHLAKERYRLAEDDLQQALEIKEKVLGSNHLEVALSAEGLARVYQKLDKAPEAERYYQQALAIREKALGADHPSVAATLHNLANFYRDKRRYKPAEPLYQRALAIKEKSLGKENPAVASLLDNYAALLRETKRTAEADQLTERAKAIRAKASVATP